MSNGDGQCIGGSFDYWDLDYDGDGDTTECAAALSNGSGDLTDGVVALNNWFVVENAAGTGPYVGWADRNTAITFRFAHAIDFNTVTIYVDDANGVGGVTVPLSVNITVGTNSLRNFPLTDPGTSTPTSFTLNVGDETGDRVVVELVRRTQWIMLSEVEFSTARV